MKTVFDLVVALFVLFGLMLIGGCDTKVSDYRAEKFQEIKAKVEHEPAWVYLMQKVLDDRHKSVRAKSIEVEDVCVQTLGNDEVVKRDLSNLRSIDVKFRAAWDGTFHKDGYTCSTFVFDKDWNLKRIIPGETDAKIDLAGDSGETQKAIAQALQNAKEKVDEVVDATKAMWDELDPQTKEEMKKLAAQVEAALLQKMVEGLKSTQE
ncbi:MAG: hypothetical protein Q4G65_13570 [bacterium]|nr:hypothetical protein [bacterium]